MIKLNSKLMLASTALVSAVAMAGTASAATELLSTPSTITVSGTTYTTGGVISDAATAVGMDVADATLNLSHNVTGAATSGISISAASTLMVDTGITLTGTGVAALLTAGDVTSTLTNHGTLTGSTGLGINTTTATSAATTINNAGTITGSVILGAGTNAINLTNGSTLTGVLTGGAGTDALVIGNLSMADTSGTISYVNTAKTTTVTGAVTAVESLSVTSGTADFTAAVGDASLATVSVSSGATLDLNSTLTATTVTMDGSLTTAGGAITGNVNFGANADVAGAYLMGATSHTIVTAGNTFSSTITGGAGNDTMTVNGSTTSGALDLAGGALDVLNVTAGTYTVAGVDNIETINVTGGMLKSSAIINNAVAMNISSGAEVSGTALTTTADLTTSGTLGLSGALTVGDELIVNAGTVNINAASTVATSLTVVSGATVNVGAALTGIDMLNNAAGSKLVVAKAGSIQSVAGSANLKNATIEIDGAGAFGTIEFTAGTEELDFTTNQVGIKVAQGYDLNLLDGDTFTSIVQGGTGSTAVSPTTGITGGNAIVKYTWVANGDDYNLVTNLRTAGVTTLAGAATGTNNKGVAAVIDSTALASLYEDVLLESDTQSALESLSPDVSGGATAATIGTSVASAGTVSNRLALLRGTDNGRSGMVAGEEMMANRGMWIQAFGTSAEQDERKGVKGYDATSTGLAIGVDSEEFFADTTVGVAFSYATADVDSDAANNAQTDINAYQLMAYASHDLANGVYVDGTIGYSFNENEAERTALGNTYKGEYDSNTFTLGAEAGKSYDWKETKVTPFVGFNYLNVESDNYNETGTGGGALAINSDDVSAFLISVGSDIEWNIAGKDGATYMPYLRAKYSYDAIADEVETSSSFLAGGTAFASKGADVAKSALTLGTGVNVITAAGFEFTAAYDAEIKEDFVAHSGVLQARWAF